MNQSILYLILISFSCAIQAKTCDIPMSEVEVGSITLAQDFKHFQVKHPSAILEDDYTISINGTRGGTDEEFQKVGVQGNWFIAYDPSQKITAYSLSYEGGVYATLDTPIELFKERIIQNSNLPTQGWKLVENGTVYRYECKDYQINIRQDYGLGRGTLGPNVSIFSKYHRLFKE